ncbi:hypothetical protein [Massilia sp. BHUDP2]|uniref:hypothetical protein n=1 Tax=Massilia sp. BHUDP2 TaxID=3034505 RepID=UPI0039065A51
MTLLQQQASVALQDHLVGITIVAVLVLVGLVWVYLGWRKYKKGVKTEDAVDDGGADDKTT